MRTKNMQAALKAALRVVCLVPLAVVGAFGQQQVNLTAAPAIATMPDGSAVPMWGYSCGVLPTTTTSTATCAPLNPNAGSGWSPIVITVPTTAAGGLQINLTNNLSFNNGNSVPTSLTIVGQLGGGLGTPGGFTPKVDHSSAQSTVTWSTVGPAPVAGVPPVQGPRVRSFGTEVAAGATTALTWSTLRPGTYLIESGTHPSIQGSMGLYGILVVTSAPTATSGTETASGTAYPNVSYDADLPLLMSEIDPVQNNTVSAAVNHAGFSETAVWSGQPKGCGNPTSSTYLTCYPPVVNYTPLYYMFNGVAFDKTNASHSLFPARPGTLLSNAKVLVRFVNAGLKMHVPAIVGSQPGTTTSTAAGFSLIAEDGNVLPGVPRIQSEVFLAAGKTYDVMISAPTAGSTALPVYDRELSLSGNATQRDAGMLAYIGINGAGLPAVAALGGAVANPDAYQVVPGNTLTVSDTSKGVIANDVNVYGVKVATPPTNGTLTLAANGTFTYVPNSSWTSDSFVYQANGNGPTATVTLGLAAIEANTGIIVHNKSFTSKVATFLSIKSPGLLSCADADAGCVVDQDAKGYPLTVDTTTIAPAGSGWTISVDKNGGFIASVPSNGTYTFTYKAKNSQGTQSASAATVTLNFPAGSGLTVNLIDGTTHAQINNPDYRWIIEEDRTFFVDPTKTQNNGGTSIVPTYGTNFHTASMPVVAQGCVGTVSCEAGQMVVDASGNHVAAVCDGDGVCRTSAAQQTSVDPSQVVLDPTKRYYISVLPGDAGTPFATGNFTSTPNGHAMGGAPIAVGQLSVNVITEPTPLPPGKLSVFVFEDDFPLNGEQDGGGGVDVLSPNEPGLGQFNLVLMDAMGGTGDFTGQMSYDMFNQPLSNSLAGTKDPLSGFDACPISTQATSNSAQQGITGMIVTCPKYESDGKTLSPLAGQAVIANLMPGRFSVIATPGADRIARGEEWLQTNTLDGQKAHDSFIRIGEPTYFQEFGPAGYHVSIGFANPKIINSRLAGVCNGTDINITGPNCQNTVTGKVTTERMSRTPDERLYSSGSRDSFYFTQCYASLGDPDGEDFAFTKCAADGTFTFTGIPDGNWRITTFDQWNDQLVDGLSWPVSLNKGASSNTSHTTNIGELPANQWQANLYTRTFIDDNKDGLSQSEEGGIPLAPVSVRYRDGSLANTSITDAKGVANFNEEFPLFNWYVVETDVTRYKNTGTHVVYDAGGPADGTPCGASVTPPTAPCGTSTIGKFLANTAEKNSVPNSLRVPGAVYCADADCMSQSLLTNRNGGGPGGSTGRIDPPWVGVEGWQGFSGQNNFIEFGKTPYVPGETGGIKGHVVYASTRPFDDPQMLVQTQWEPLVAHVTINLYKEGTAPDGTQSLTLVDTTQTSSFDDWAQGFRADGMPNMNCPGQDTGDLFYFTLYNQPNYLNTYNAAHGGPAAPGLPYNSQYKCYDGMHNWNQIQPAPYDGMYAFPSVTSVDANGKPNGTNCKACTTNPDTTDPLRAGMPMLPAGKYVVEVVVPPGYELVKEEDKNILIGDNFIAPATQQFPGLGGNIFIMPDQAEVASSYNANNAYNSTNSLGASPINGLVPAFPVEPIWPCVGESRTVPDYISLFPQSKQASPFAGATRNLCDRKEVTLGDQTSATAKFFIFTSTHVTAHFTGVITDDFTSEFDPFSPQFGEKFAPPDLPVSVKDWKGNEIARTYADHWGIYDGLNYSTWEVNPPNPTGYSPTMMVMCMNDRGSGITPDPLFNPGYSQFCYELPFMPGQTQYMDTPVTPTSAFSEGYNHPDCAYPDATPAISRVDGDGGQGGPWASAPGVTLTITALGDQQVINNGYSGPAATTAPFNMKTVKRHYGFGSATGTVTIGGKNAPVAPNGWADGTITVTVPAGVPACAVQQQAQYGGSAAQCGQLVITTASGKQSIDTVTVTIGGKKPTYVSGNAPLLQSGAGSIQQAIDAAQPGDLIIVPPGVYNEMLLMWKPVRLQGVGAASSIIDANTQPAGKLDPWRREVTCLFGLALNGTPITSSNAYDPANTFTCTPAMQFQVDRLPLEAVVGWDATLNGNLAELLQEPTLMGAYEGAGITVLAKGVNFNGGAPFAADTFPTGSTLLTTKDCSGASNPFPSNFWCNPSRIDGLTVTDSSQGGGGIFVHAWAHQLEISNDRVHGNTGTLSGGISIGQGEFPPQYLGGAGVTNAAPGSCQTSLIPNQQLPYCFNMQVNVHNNAVTLNNSIGDELFSATPAGAGGVSFCTGADYYKFNYNWVCGNLSTGDGGGLAHLGFSYNGDIEHNSILFNQSVNPTIATNGGGIIIQGSPDADPVCGNAPDADCPPGLSDGTGPGLVINANLIMGNSAESGSGGGLRLQGVNGTEVATFPILSALWYSVNVTNNIITNNVAGWDGAGVSLQDALAVNLVNNTIASNDTTASAGVLFNTLGAPLASSQGPTCTANCGTTSAPQPAGLVAMQNSAVLATAMPANITFACPLGHAVGLNLVNGACKNISYPLLYNNLFWQNRSFYIGVNGTGTGTLNQQNTVALLNAFTHTPVPSEPTTDATTAQGNGSVITGGTGACTVPTVTGAASYWDIGVRGDKGPGDHGSGWTLAPTYSVLTNATENGLGSNNTQSNPTVVSQYCNGSRTPPEFKASGYQVPPGISDATVPNPVFNLTPAATVDEGNNWINMSWGPLAMTNPVSGVTLGNYAPAAGSPAINQIGPTAIVAYNLAPSTDFFGTPRKTATDPKVDIGAVEYVAPILAVASVTGGPLAFGNVGTGVTSPAKTLTVSNTGNAPFTGITLTFSSPLYSSAGGTCGTTLAAGSTCTINVVFSPTGAGLVNATLTITGNVPVTGSPVALSGTGVAPLAIASVTGGPLAFGNVIATTTSTAQTLTLHNTGNAPFTGITLAFNSSSYARSATSAGTCGATLAAGSTCTINVVFSPTAAGLVNATLTITGNVAVTGSPVSLSGTGLAVVRTATLTPATWTPSQTRNCPGIGLGVLACAADPTQLFTLANTGNVPLTSISTGTLTGTNTADYTIVASALLGTTCGTTVTTLAPGATCGVRVQFKPLTTEAAGSKTVTLNVTAGAAGAKQSAISGTAN